MSNKQQAWRNLVKHTYHTNKAKNKNYTFRQALKDSARLKNNGKNTTQRNHRKHNRKHK